jgi:capsular polysaccharide transport system permease protein
MFSPTIAAIIYFGFFATERYVSEAQFLVRTASRPASVGGLSTILQMSGLGSAQEEVFAVQSFISSRNAIDQLQKRIPAREMYGVPEADMLARYPSFVYGPSQEEFQRYLSWMIRTVHNSNTGITTLRVQAFKPEDAHRIAVQLLELSEIMINELNERIQRDSVRMAEAEAKRQEERLIAAQQAITRFRNAELMIDPAGSSIVITELIGRLSGELSKTEAQIREVSSASGTNPQLQSLHGRAEALRGQIARERTRISSDSEGLADKLAIYERFVLDREFAKQSLDTAVRAFEAAQVDARRQQLYLERIVEPLAPDRAMAPERLHMIISTVGLNFVIGAALWLAFSGWREHASQT